MLLVICQGQASTQTAIDSSKNNQIIETVLITVIEETDVPALQEGPITKIDAREGTQVKPGDLLFQIDERRAKIRVAQAESEMIVARKKAETESEIVLAKTETRLSEASLQRALESRKRFPDTPSQAEVDDILLKIARAKQHLEKSKHDKELSELALKSAELQLELAKIEYENHQIRSPIRGVVVELKARVGEWVKPGQRLVRVLRVDKLRAEGFMTLEQAQKTTVGAAVTVVPDGSSVAKLTLPGKIVFISPEVDTNDNRKRFIAEIDNAQEKLAPGSRAKLIIKGP
jgi:multidrug resistance efflux pump